MYFRHFKYLTMCLFETSRKCDGTVVSAIPKVKNWNHQLLNRTYILMDSNGFNICFYTEFTKSQILVSSLFPNIQLAAQFWCLMMICFIFLCHAYKSFTKVDSFTQIETRHSKRISLHRKDCHS